MVSEVQVVSELFFCLIWIKLEALNNLDSQPQQQISNRMTEKEKIQSVAVIQSLSMLFQDLKRINVNKCGIL